jgi:protein O-GlcNAc transferase
VSVPPDIGAAVDQALALHQAGALEEAGRAYRRLLDAVPDLAQVRHLLGVLRHQGGDTAGGARAIKTAIVQEPGEPVFYGNLSTLLIALADPAAERTAEHALILSPGFQDGLINRAAARLHRGAIQAAIEDFRALIRQAPDRPDLYDRLANALEALGDFGAALPWRRRIACAVPADPTVLAGMASCLMMAGDGRGARRHLAQGTILAPTPAARFRAAHAQNRVPESAEDIADARARLLAFLDTAEDEELAIADPAREVGLTNFNLTYHDLNNRELNRRIGAFYLRACPDLAWTAPHCRRQPRPGRRIRVVVVSVFLGSHTIGKLFGTVLARLPRERFEVVAAAHAKPGDAAWIAQMRGADGQVILSHDLAQARRQLAAVEADLLLYLDIGMDPFTYYLSFARLAPVQAVCVGHPDTTGVPNIDYFLTTRGSEPPDWRAHYSERAILLDEFPFFYNRPPPVGALAGRADLGLPETATLYTCPQTLFKMHPDHDGVFLEILRRDPNGLLVLIESAQPLETERMRARLAAAGPDVFDRVRFQRRMNGLEYLGFVASADLLVETFGFAGGNSTYEALSTGTPILAYAGKHMRARVTLDLLSMIGLGDCVAADRERFITMALDLANDTGARREARRRVPEASPALFERQRAVDGLAAFLERAVDASRAGTSLEPGPLEG